MKQLLQSYRSGELWMAEVPAPSCRDGGVLVRTRHSVVSMGTERALLALARKSLIGKVRARPELAAKVLKRVRVEGIAPALKKALGRLEDPVPLGYSASGEVVEVGRNAGGLRPGDRVALAGAGYATHAEFNYVPRNLCVKIPDGVTDQEASFATIGAIALQGVRQAMPLLGERVVVIGLGLIGLLTAQLLRANGCSVLGVDSNSERVSFAQKSGYAAARTTEAVEASKAFTEGQGADAVIVAAATTTSEPVVLAGEVSRAKGRVVVVGLVGMDIPREIYYRKELDLRLSMSYGPGRYDPTYEELGQDYPFAHVRFTAQRNMQSFLDLVHQQKLAPTGLVSHRFAFEDALDAYALLDGRPVKERNGACLGILLTYAIDAPVGRTVWRPKAVAKRGAQVGVAVIGAGAFARDVLLPLLRKAPGLRLVGVCTQSGRTAQQAAARYMFEFATTDIADILAEPGVDAVMIATRHGDHAALAEAALRAGKHVFVEKPLCIVEADLDRLDGAVQEVTASSPGASLAVGFNRRFSGHARVLQTAFEERRTPMVLSYRVNAGALPKAHWTHDPREGGGRIIGEVCHFVDFCTAVVGSLAVAVVANGISSGRSDVVTEDSVVITIDYADGSVATIQYVAEGHAGLGKERCEVFAGGRSAVMDDFRVTRLFGGGTGVRGKQDKGFAPQLHSFTTLCREGGDWPIPWTEILNTHRVCFGAIRSLRTGQLVRIPA